MINRTHSVNEFVDAEQENEEETPIVEPKQPILKRRPLTSLRSVKHDEMWPRIISVDNDLLSSIQCEDTFYEEEIEA